MSKTADQPTTLIVYGVDADKSRTLPGSTPASQSWSPKPPR
jgi:hypothetical protein